MTTTRVVKGRVMRSVTRSELKEMLDSSDVTLVETLPRRSYDIFHLPGAINVPLDEGFEEAIREAVPDNDQPVVVYGLDEDCDESQDAYRLMEDLGYEEVYEYTGGKVDWNEAGLPVET